MALGVEVGLGEGHTVLDGDPAPAPKRGRASQFLAHVYCGQKAVCIRIPLGIEVGLALGDNVLDGNPAPPTRDTVPPIFGPCLLWPNGCMYQDTTWYGGRPQPRRHCVRWGPSPFP